MVKLCRKTLINNDGFGFKLKLLRKFFGLNDFTNGWLYRLERSNKFVSNELYAEYKKNKR